MKNNVIQYRSGYKYQIVEDYVVQLPELVNVPYCRSEYITLLNGELRIREGYAWDGPSGPTIDTRNFMRGSLVHDALYQLMRENHLDHDKYRDTCDRILQRICIEDGMWQIRAWWVYQGVRFGAGPAADPINDKPVLHAP